jgi:hypothetical protein
MNPVWYLVMWFVAALALGCLGTYPAAYRRGWARATIEAGDRHRHRHGDPQETTLLELPRAGRLPLERLADPAPLPSEVAWVFAGGWDEGASGSGEYELLTRTAEQPEVGSLEWTAQRVEEVRADERAAAAAETDSGFTRRMALIVAEIDDMIDGHRGDVNYLLHTHRADT